MVQGRPHIVSVIWAVRISAELLMLLLVLLSLTRMDERPVMFVVHVTATGSGDRGTVRCLSFAVRQSSVVGYV